LGLVKTKNLPCTTAATLESPLFLKSSPDKLVFQPKQALDVPPASGTDKRLKGGLSSNYNQSTLERNKTMKCGLFAYQYWCLQNSA
jgi:hypothetical protein